MVWCTSPSLKSDDGMCPPGDGLLSEPSDSGARLAMGVWAWRWTTDPMVACIRLAMGWSHTVFVRAWWRVGVEMVLVVLLVLGALVALVVELRSDDDAQVHDVDVQHVDEGQPGRRHCKARCGFPHTALED